MARVCLFLFVCAVWLAGCGTGGGSAPQPLSAALPFAADQLPPLPPAAAPRADSAVTFTQLDGVDCESSSGNTAPDGDSLVLSAAAGKLSWAIYRFFDVTLDLGDSVVEFQNTPTDDGVLYVGLADFDRNTWVFSELAVDSGLDTDDLAIPQHSPYTSGADELCVLVATWDDMATTLDYVNLGMGVPADAPQNLTAADGQNAEFILVTWDPVEHAVGYLLEYKRTVDDETAWEALVDPPGLSWHQYGHVWPGTPDTDPEYDVSYDYRVRTFFADGDTSPYSSVDSGYCMFTAPENFSATFNIHLDGIELSWDEVDTAAGYEVFRRYYLEEPFSHLDTTSETTYFDDSLPDSDIYEYQVLAFSPRGDGPRSAIAQGSTLGFSMSDFQTFQDSAGDIRMMRHSGRIIVAYFNTRYDDLYFAYANNLNPIGISSWVHMDLNQSTNSGQVALGELDGKPAVAFRLDINDDVKFTRCTKAFPFDSPSWDVSVLDDLGGAWGRPAWVVTNGKPAVCFHTDDEGSDAGLYYYYSTVAAPSDAADWQRYRVSNGSGAGQAVGMDMVAGKPAIVTSNGDFSDHEYHAATSAAPVGPTDWQTTSAPGGSSTSRLCEMLIHQGNPLYAISLYICSEPYSWDLEIYRAAVPTPAGGSDWIAAGQFWEEGVDLGQNLDLAIVNDRPAICYYDETNNKLMLALSKDETPQEDSWVVNTVGEGTDVGAACALMEYKGAPAMLYYDAVAMKIKFAQGE